MNRIFILLFSLTILSCNSAYKPSTTTDTAFKSKAPKIGDETFDISLHLDKVKNDQYNLSVSLELDDGSYVISPFSKDSIFGSLSISISETNNLVAENPLLEIPSSVEEMDPVINEPV